MAFTFTVEDGTGLSNSNSYLTVSEADDIVAVNIHADVGWTALSETSKEKLLAWASRYLDNHANWRGTKAVKTSALRWPRCGVTDRDSTEIAEDEIPMQLKIAVASMAIALIEQDRSVERDTDGLTRIKADVVELEFIEGYRLPQVPTHISHLIYGLGTIRSSHIRFARIIR